MITCPICEEAAEEIASGGYDGKHIRCRTCDEYRITGNAIAMMASMMREKRTKVLARARRAGEPGKAPEVNSAMFDEKE